MDSRLIKRLTKDESVFSITQWVAWKQKAGLYSFKKLPKRAILSPLPMKRRLYQRFFEKRLKGLQGNNVLLGKDTILSSGVGVGAPAWVAQMEELRANGVKAFFWIGIAGRINAQLKEGEAFIVDAGYSATGVTSYYNALDDEITVEYDRLIKILEQTGLSTQKVLSVDAPFRETKDLISFYKDKGVGLVDMETAAIMQFSKYYNLECTCILIAADNLSDNKWLPPKKMSKINNNVRYWVKKISEL
jgi:uridine phosphorylase